MTHCKDVFNNEANLYTGSESALNNTKAYVKTCMCCA